MTQIPIATGPMVVVAVDEVIDRTLTGHGGLSYQSPPQPREEALALVSLLLGRPPESLDGDSSWSCPVAGGRRTITISSVQAASRPADRVVR